MTEKERERKPSGISRREFLKDVYLAAGGGYIGYIAVLAACTSEEVVKTETATRTITVTAARPPVTKTVEEAVFIFVCPTCEMNFDTLAALRAHLEAAHPKEPGEVEPTPTESPPPTASPSPTESPTPTKSPTPTESPDEAGGKMVTLNIDGVTYNVETFATTKLLDVLRFDVGTYRNHKSCEGSYCWSCRVEVDGQLVQACSTYARDCVGKNIVTTGGPLPPLY